MKFWLLTGTEDNWERALGTNTWGVIKKHKSRWDELEKGDIVLLYGVSPIKGIIGIARVQNKFIQDTPFWKEEIQGKQVIWPFRFDFTVEYVLPRSEWQNRKLYVKGIGKRVIAGISSIKDVKLVEEIFEQADKKWGTRLGRLIVGEEELAMPLSPHDEMKEKLLEMGRLGGFISESEYKFPDIKEKVDVVWRKVPASVPRFHNERFDQGHMRGAFTY